MKKHLKTWRYFVLPMVAYLCWKTYIDDLPSWLYLEHFFVVAMTYFPNLMDFAIEGAWVPIGALILPLMYVETLFWGHRNSKKESSTNKKSVERTPKPKGHV